MAYILGKDLDNWEDSVATQEPYSLSNDEKIGPQYITGSDLIRSAKINSEWKTPVATSAQAYEPMYISGQMARSFWDSLADYVAEIAPNAEITSAQNAIELLDNEEKPKKLADYLISGDLQLVKELGSKGLQIMSAGGVIIPGLKETADEIREKATTYDEAVELLNDRDYPLEKYAKRILADNTNHVENRRMVRELYKQSQGIDSSKWYNQAASIMGAIVPAAVAAKMGYKGALLGGTSRANAIRTAMGITQSLIGTQAAGEYAEETAAEYVRRTGDKTFENFTAKDATGLNAIAYGAINSQIEFLGGVEPIMAGALNKIGLRSGLIQAGLKIGAGEATEEFLQGMTELLMRKMDGTTEKTWGEGILEALKGAVWGLFIGGATGTPAFYMNRRNLVKGIRSMFPQLNTETATQVADAMIDTVGEISSQDQTLRNNLRQKIDYLFEKTDLDNKEDRIDAMTDLEYSLIVMDSADRGIDLKDHELFQGEVTPIGWFRAGIPENMRADVKTVIDNITELETQLEELNKAEEKDWAKIEEIENKLAQQDEWVRNKLSDIISKESFVRELNKLESKYVAKQKKKAGIPVDTITEPKQKSTHDYGDVQADNVVQETKDGKVFQYISNDQDGGRIRLLTKKGEIIGQIDIRNNGVGYIYVEPKYRRNKNAETLWKEAQRFINPEQVMASQRDDVKLEDTIAFWEKQGFTFDGQRGTREVDKNRQLEPFPTRSTLKEPTVTEETKAIEEAEKVENGTITSGTPENQTENIIQDYGEKIEGAKKDMYADGEISAKKPEKSTIDKVMEKAPKHEEESKVFRDWLEKQDSTFVEMIKELRLPIVVFKTENYKQQLRDAYKQEPLLKLEKSLIDVIYGWEELSDDTLKKFGITPEYEFYFRTGKHQIQSLTPENVSAYLGGRTSIKFTYQKSTDGNYYLWGNKGNNGSWIPLIKFNSQEDMNAHKESHNQTDLEKIYNEMTTYKPTKEKVIRERVGTDYRNGKNITEEEFAKQFGFRGVQFGNYEKNEKRQRELNNSYDSFMDLANLLNLPPKALSLGGTLGIAFGARGSGSALAHYEPDLKVINITRDAGAGALAHEWFHALDNYLANNLSEYANMAGGGWVTKSGNYYYYKINQELSDSLKQYVRAIKEEKDFQLRLRQLGQYWKRDWEVAARLFEQYVSFKTAEQNNINDYLASPQSYYTSATPYLTAEEASRVFPKLENMLNSIKTREDENQNIVLYQPAYAGSRVDYDRPSLKFIGTGEGNQSHGWGLYYALLLDVAEGYRRRFSDENIYFKGEQIVNTDSDNIGSDFWVFYNIKQKGFENAKKYYEEGLDIFETATKNYPNDEYAKKEVENYKTGLKKINSLTAEDIEELTKQSGQVVEVDIPEMVDLLDEQKTYAEQSEYVKKALKNMLYSVRFEKYYQEGQTPTDFVNQEITDWELGFNGGQIYDRISNLLDSDKEASLLMNEYGIKGITYEGGIDGRCFVIFNADDVKVLRKKFDKLGNMLFQNRKSGAAPATYRGAYIPQLRFIQRTNKMDASTLSHELAHDWFETNFYRYRDGKMSKDFMKAWGALEKALGITEKDKVPQRQASEIFARAYEAWLTSNENWNKLIAVDDKDKDAVAKLMQDYQNALRDIYNDISNPYFKQTWGKLGELKPELKAWFDRMVDVKDLDVLVERGEMTPEQASQEKLNQAIDKVIENTKDAETAQTLKEVRTLNDTKRYEAEGGNKNSIQMRLSALAREIDENNMAVKGNNYDTHRDMMAVAEAADNFVKTRLEDALAIINGQMAEVEGLFKEDLYTALERLAIENGDMGLIDELRNSEVANRLAKELGQRVAGFRNWKSTTEIDVLSAVKSLDNKFNEALKNKKAQKQFNEALDMLDKELKAQDKLADKELDATLKELECK